MQSECLILFQNGAKTLSLTQIDSRADVAA